MSQGSIPYLMYHEIEVPGRRVIQDTPGYLRYVVREKDFSDQLSSLVDSGFVGVNVTDALTAKSSQKVVAITFDDGCETDLLAAAPRLKELGFTGTFYIVAGFLNRAGYLSAAGLRELNELGMEVGSHSMSHCYLRQLNTSELKSEIFDSKQQLEQITGKQVDHFSCPGGRWDSRVQRMAEDAGYRSVVTSEIGLNTVHSDFYRLKRLAIFRETSIESFLGLLNGDRLFSRQIRNAFLDGAKDLLGDERYDRLRASVLDNLRSAASLKSTRN